MEFDQDIKPLFWTEYALKKQGDIAFEIEEALSKYHATPSYVVYDANVANGVLNPKTWDPVEEARLLGVAEGTPEYEQVLASRLRLKEYEKQIDQKYNAAKFKIYDYCESLLFPLYQRMTCVNTTRSTFVSNRATAGYSYFWGARHGRDPVPVCDDCEDNVRDLLVREEKESSH